MSNECLNSGECRQYCQVLNGLTNCEATDPCEWPKKVLTDEEAIKESANPELAQYVADSLFTVLTTGNKIQENMSEAGSELSVAYSAHEKIFDAHVELWKQFAEAAEQDRVVTDIEVDYFTEKIEETVNEADAEIQAAGVSSEIYAFAQALHDRKTLETYGLLFDETMMQTVTELCVNVASGRSSLLIGDKGIAKTQAAKFVSKLFSENDEPKIISGDGSMMKDEFIGKMTLTEKNGASVTTFKKGILTECMEKGIPLVMDEINLIDPAIVMRLQDILLRKPGDKVTLQEDGGEVITIQQGFCVIATANEASNRYQSRAALDPAFRDRFRIIPIEYPDGETFMLQSNDRPASLARLAHAFVISGKGIASERVSEADALWLASVAHASQQLYSKPAKDVQVGQLGTNVASVVDDSEPRMSDCITPRKMVDILQTIDEGLNPYNREGGVQGLTYDTISAMQHTSDRETMFEIIRLLYDGNMDDLDENAIKKQLRI